MAPADFNVLFNLGAVAASAGHYERAREVFETASRQQPQNVEVLVRLADVHYELNRPQARCRCWCKPRNSLRGAPTFKSCWPSATSLVGALEDALAAWDAYLKLVPDDDFARRDRAYTAVRMGQVEKGIAELERFLARHPDDAVGHYQMGVAQGQSDPVQGLAHLDRALALKPDFAAALSARGSLYYQQGKPEAAVARPGGRRQTAPRRCHQPGPAGTDLSCVGPCGRCRGSTAAGRGAGARRIPDSASLRACPGRCGEDRGIEDGDGTFSRLGSGGQERSAGGAGGVSRAQPRAAARRLPQPRREGGWRAPGRCGRATRLVEAAARRRKCGTGKRGGAPHRGIEARRRRTGGRRPRAIARKTIRAGERDVERSGGSRPVRRSCN